MRSTDVIVVGLGAAGAATLYHLARHGVRAIGIDRFSPPHTSGSTHGDTRITREAIGEGEEYAPLVRRSHVLWRELEAETDTDLLTECGGLIIEASGGGLPGQRRHGFLDHTIACANRYGIPHEMLTAPEITARFPQFRLQGDENGYYEPGAGFLRPERCIEAELTVASRLGAEVRRDERVLSLEAGAGAVRVQTSREVLSAKRVVVAVGPWIRNFVAPKDRELFTVYRQVLCWFTLSAGANDHRPGAMPVFIWGIGEGSMFYGFPAVDDESSIKVATEQFETSTTADTAEREVTASETRSLHDAWVSSRLPGVTGRAARAVRCLYTVTPDGRFVVDEHPDLPGVLLVSPCSGHGFKHSLGLGEAITQLVTTGTSDADLAPFSLERFRQEVSEHQPSGGRLSR